MPGAVARRLLSPPLSGGSVQTHILIPLVRTSTLNTSSAGVTRLHRARCETVFHLRNYDLAATLNSGQAFGWTASDAGWTGVVHGRWVCLRQVGQAIHARTVEPQSEWHWLKDYLQVKVNLGEVLASFPDDPHLRAAQTACRGLRLLRQEPWECLASFILSSTKQIIQIQQIVAALRSTFGTPVSAPNGQRAFAFPAAARLAVTTEAGLRACKMGFRAPYLLTTARRVASGECDLESLRGLTMAEARERLLALPGVGTKIADCVLLFAYGFPTAFPVDVWVAKAIRRFYFRGRQVKPARARNFIATHFGPNSGYAQQYLFHYIRTVELRTLNKDQ